ncbi:hypothetical protein K438DRAFT_1987722 [Mycena galopus ATCC 62051]|nr:hypothetical protein K438DRAFT_1987722 [Mycena galopus ATCC 62051]
MQKVTEEWAPTGVKSIFTLCLQDSTGTAQRPTSAGAGVQYTAICGFGWRFSFQVDLQSAPAVVVDDAGHTIDSFQLQLSFDPHLIRSAAYDTIALAVQVEHLIPLQQAPAPIPLTLPWSDRYTSTLSLGSYVYASTAAAPSISITLTFPATLGLTLPHPLEPQMERALERTLTGEELVDVKFYAFSRRESDCVTHPLPLFAKSALLKGFSDDLDAFLTEHGFSESAVVDLDVHDAEQGYFEGYGYDTDSDLDSDSGDDEPEAAPEALASDVEVSSTLKRKGARMGRVIVLKDTAYKTWKALLYYLYTRRVNFRPLKSEGPKKITVDGPVCSPKSMYRLADKLGLEELRTLALASLSSRLSENNILEEVFSFFTSLYPVIQELEIGVLTSNFSDKASEGLKEMTEKICKGEKPYCAETLLKIIQKMADNSEVVRK